MPDNKDCQWHFPIAKRNRETYSPGQRIISMKSWTAYTIATVHKRERVYVTRSGHAVGFDDCYRVSTPSPGR